MTREVLSPELLHRHLERIRNTDGTPDAIARAVALNVRECLEALNAEHGITNTRHPEDCECLTCVSCADCGLIGCDCG